MANDPMRDDEEVSLPDEEIVAVDDQFDDEGELDEDVEVEGETEEP